MASCDLVRTAPPLCIKSKRRSGYLRLLLALVVPLGVGLAFTQALVCYAQRRERKRFGQLAQDVQRLRKMGGLQHLQGFDFETFSKKKPKRKKKTGKGKNGNNESDSEGASVS